MTYLSNRAAALMSANRYEEALADSKMAEGIEPSNIKVLQRLARIYVNLGQPQDSLHVYARISAMQPVTAQEKGPAESMHTHLAQAESVLREGTAGSMAIHALDQAERYLGAGADRPRKWQLMRGEAYLKMGNVNALGEAQNIAMSLLRKNNKDPEALVLRGRALYGQGDNEKALQHFREALSCDPDFKDAVKYLRLVQKLDRMKEEGNAAFKSGKYRQAVDLYGQALEVDPHNKGTNSKILQNRAMASIKVIAIPPPSLDSFAFADPCHTNANPISIAQRLQIRHRRLHSRPEPRTQLSQSAENAGQSSGRIGRLGSICPGAEKHRGSAPARTRDHERHPQRRARAQKEQAQRLLQDPRRRQGRHRHGHQESLPQTRHCAPPGQEPG